MLEQIKAELKRLDATDVHVEIDHEFEPDAGMLIKVSYDGAFWHLLPGELDKLMSELPNGGGGEAVKQAIEAKAQAVWRGPSPLGSRDTST